MQNYNKSEQKVKIIQQLISTDSNMEQTLFVPANFIFSVAVSPFNFISSEYIASGNTQLSLALYQTLNSLCSSLSTIQEISKQMNKSQVFIDQSVALLDQREQSQPRKPIIQANTIVAQNKLINKIFGRKLYRYRLKLKEKFPQLIYKERLFNIQVCLIDSSGNQIFNSNILNLYVSACDSNGQILQSQNKQSFIQGKTQTQLIGGKAQFKKLFASQITRNLTKKQFSLLIYARPSLLNLDDRTQASQNNKQQMENMYMNYINYQQVMPLTIERIRCMAKKKKNQYDYY